MPERDPIDRLDELVQAILTGAGESAHDAELAGLLEVATALHGMPTEDFRDRLAGEIAGVAGAGVRGAGGANMTTTSVSDIREGIRTIVPYLRIERVADLLEFVKQAFGAVETMRVVGSAGGLHVEARMDDSRVMMGGFQGMRSMPTALHLYVQDADSMYARALAAGATTLHPPVDQPYGDREASVQDPFGNHWYIATHRAGPEGTHRPAALRTVTPYLHPRGAARLIDFLSEAFGAEEHDRDQSPDGVIHHATVRLGDSAIEMGEAHGEWQPMPAAIYVYVADVDALYQRALRAGAVSVEPPRDQPYGDRTAHVEDPHGNVWYLAQPIPPR
jgi:PhnB protein